MIAVSSSTMRSIEQLAFDQGHSPWSLMLEAGRGIAETILHYYPHAHHVIAYLGKGNNAGDALVALKHLKEAGWQIELRAAYPLDSWGELPKMAYTELGKPALKEQTSAHHQSILIDAMLGTGTQGELRAPLITLVQEINKTRALSGAVTVSLDVPSGLSQDASPVISDHCIQIGLPKDFTLDSQHTDKVGAISHVPLTALDLCASAAQQLIGDVADAPQLICPASLTRMRRPYGQHKGMSGRVGIWAGSEGMLGAAALAATACLKSGAGLITVFIPPTLYPVLATMVPLEVMVQPAIDPRIMLDMEFDSLIIGPGIGTPVPSLAERLLQVIEQSNVPTVIDADALNLIASEQRHEVLNHLSIITPHPGEFQRLFPHSGSREDKARLVQSESPATLVYKGSRTIVCSADSPQWINSTGTPAMASAGQGDVLSGLIAGLCAQGYTSLESSKLAVWLAGEAAQLALSQESTETLTASSVIEFLPEALQSLPARD
ncbi:bifunctional ADP-dependent NAD(P)H-hydrate dehydratase/NAD(P)H-hydrate epimerase [Rubritalea marina]|uniref:bifunctional ADP-dependent NAD(P)H-hydrate dehydratase/NAD(P)H-hydrate epimerase n=1 Tax=Rubritalea marina TaxID=361055 RepID=UPI0003741891|nr:bifunctional ADP-dependent NAD(P)H-hydrate dehydratase/NAD(P)H-hydrate epimerase [Rubritalea marina]